MMPKPLIALTCRSLAKEVGSRLVQTVPTSYIQTVLAHGGIPVLLPSVLDPCSIGEALAKCNGLLVPGGEDVTPALYQEVPHPKLGATDPLRDACELEAIRYMLRERRPILGICRGAQILNVAAGGTLFQDLADQFPTSPPHRESELEELSHQLQLCPGTKLYDLLGEAPIGANSLHHQAVKAPGKGLRVAATTPDGVIEAIESDSHPFCIGVQCHPEVLWQSVEKRWGKLFDGFVEHCEKTISQTH
jgi:putative glutamine amidotransferase